MLDGNRHERGGGAPGGFLVTSHRFAVYSSVTVAALGSFLLLGRSDPLKRAAADDSSKHKERPNAPTSFTTRPSQPGATNYCGQAAAASIIKAWNKQGAKTDQQLIDDLYLNEASKPDILGGLLGTSPGRIRSALARYGLQSKSLWIRTWANCPIPPLPLLPDPGASWTDKAVGTENRHMWDKYEPYARDIVNHGNPCIVLVEWSAIEGKRDLGSLHWVVWKQENPAAAGEHDPTVALCDTLPNYADQTFPMDKFRRAWECSSIIDPLKLKIGDLEIKIPGVGGVGSLRFHAIAAWPTGTDNPFYEPDQPKEHCADFEGK
jgi:hypothetical protein